MDERTLAALKLPFFQSGKERQGESRPKAEADAFDAFDGQRTKEFQGGEQANNIYVVDWLCYLDSQGKCNTVAHTESCPCVGTTFVK